MRHGPAHRLGCWSQGNGDALDAERQAVDAVVLPKANLIRERFPEGLVKRWPGYGLDDYLRAPGDLCKVLGGSEGTLAAITGAMARAMRRLSASSRRPGTGSG